MTFMASSGVAVYPDNSCFTQIFELRTKNTLVCYNFSEVAQTPLSFPCPKKSEYSKFSRFVAILCLAVINTH